jgi:BirA family transcriptional regulator, biotin operon repressor / biotin---[acetyl-CoA-carboxylase] ligase
MKKTSQPFKDLVALLSDGQPHNGASIEKKLNITRPIFWKLLRKMKQHRLAVTFEQHKGHTMLEPLTLLDAQTIKQQLNFQSVFLEVFETINSTNDYLKKPSSAKKKKRVCLSETQTKGKGRFNRHWHSPFGQNIYFSLAYPVYENINKFLGLSLVVALAVCRAIEKTLSLPEPLFIKWPNDIVYDGKKLAGMLIEAQPQAHNSHNLIIGIGVNVNMQQDSKNTIKQDWTSLRQITETYHDRNALSAELINQLTFCLKEFEKDGLKAFIAAWKERDYLVGKSVQLKLNQTLFQGKVTGITDQGHLILKLPDGKKKVFSSGDTTLL